MCETALEAYHLYRIGDQAEDRVERILTAVTPLIEAGALERAAQLVAGTAEYGSSDSPPPSAP